jgi:hypothetical protein
MGKREKAYAAGTPTTKQSDTAEMAMNKELAIKRQYPLTNRTCTRLSRVGVKNQTTVGLRISALVLKPRLNTHNHGKRKTTTMRAVNT